ncbi:MAG: hypothetical protein CVV49_05340 [Spirochaetae bacterium HGW-Spirochaetae-5]|nr:MAG: hypothetical protein CVV49_05340 [Spirochaetae bacterium HGW-Spirochaetae-5]
MEKNKGLSPDNNAVRKIVFPVKLGIEPMQRLLIADFADDVEYEALEPQLFNDSINGKGLRVLRYRKDKKVDVYWQPGVFVDINTFNIGAGIGDFEEVEMSASCFEVDEYGINLHLAFNDKQNRTVEMRIKENTPNNRRIRFLAPVGNDIEKPKQFFLAYMLDFDFVKKRGTSFSASIGDRHLKPASFPLLRNFKKVFFARYSLRPSVGVMNPPMSIPLIFESQFPAIKYVEGMNVSINKNGNIESINREYENINYEIKFFPAFPNMLDLQDNQPVKGKWEFKIAQDLITSGTFSLNNYNGVVSAEIDVTGLWKPVGLPFSLNLFTKIAGFFRKWPATYKWIATVDFNDSFKMSSSWIRKEK